MKNDFFENKLCKEFQNMAQNISPSKDCKTELLSKIEKIQQKGSTPMKTRKSKFKIAAVAAACLILGATTVFGSGKIAAFVGSSSSNYDCTKYEQLDKLAKEIGLTADIPKEFSNGYSFDGANIIQNSDMDENNNVKNSYKTLDLSYTNGKNPVISISIMPANKLYDNNESHTMQRITDNGNVINYDLNTCLFLPPNEKRGLQYRKNVRNHTEIYRNIT